MIDLPAQFVGRMKNELGGEADEFFASYDLPAAKAIRVNTLKTTVERFKEISPFALQPVPWESSGFYVEDEKPGKSLAFAAGLFYVQEPSAAFAASTMLS